MEKIGYMCKTDYDWELEEALGGNTIYPSIEDLQESRPCCEHCGIIKVEIKLLEVVKPYRVVKLKEE